MIKTLFENAQKHLNYFFEHIDTESVEDVVRQCNSCEGLVVLTGVGKSGIIAEKIAMTLISTGTRALYLPAMNFLHGDIGIISDKDILIMISKSGESEELLNLLPFVKNRNCKTIAIVSNTQSRLSKSCDTSICLPVEKELCSFNLVPTTSTAVQLIFGDVLAVALMKNREFAMDDYALNHPAGAIGKKIFLKIKDLMLDHQNIPVCSPSDKLLDVLVELSNKKCGALLVADHDRRLVGIFTDGDLRRALQSNGSSVLEQNMESLMNTAVSFLSSDTLAWDALVFMQKDPSKWITVLPIVDDGKIVGILRMHDIVKAGLT
ncbi:MAG: KpsF/GutQ family sugar-phosphate isomerase [Chlamydiae bacterium]|nr:KpsF/GutQ family sugar-phosphate isomerase [Chlamydiota bacterium]